MDIVWKYKIDVTNSGIFREIEKERCIKFPNELEIFIMENNGATPSKYNFMVGTVEKALGAILSFNRGETDTDTVFTALSSVENNNLLPFAIDPFGNYICYSLNDRTIVFWDHETNNVTSTEKNLRQFLEELY